MRHGACDRCKGTFPRGWLRYFELRADPEQDQFLCPGCALIALRERTVHRCEERALDQLAAVWASDPRRLGVLARQQRAFLSQEARVSRILRNLAGGRAA